MINITQQTGSITDFTGDGIVIPCDVDLTFRKSNDIIRNVYSNAGNKLWEELAAVGYCEIGHVVITKGYNLKVKNLIFLPYTDQEVVSHRVNYLLLHQAIRSALSLASLYGLQTLAIPLTINLLPKRRKNALKTVISKVLGERTESPDTNEVENIIEGIVKGFVSESLKEVCLFK